LLVEWPQGYCLSRNHFHSYDQTIGSRYSLRPDFYLNEHKKRLERFAFNYWGLPESLDLDSLKKDILSVKIFSTVWKTTSWQSRFSRQFQVSTVLITLKIKISRFLSKSWLRVSISTVWKRTLQQSRFSWQFEKRHLDVSRHLNLDLNCSRLSRPPGLGLPDTSYLNKKYKCFNQESRWA
jgi:hypothetical protein